MDTELLISPARVGAVVHLLSQLNPDDILQVLRVLCGSTVATRMLFSR